jgi:hypothetical protein
VQDSLLHNTYCTTINGISVSYDLVDENTFLLLELTSAAFAAAKGVFREQPGGDAEKVEPAV